MFDEPPTTPIPGLRTVASDLPENSLPPCSGPRELVNLPLETVLKNGAQMVPLPTAFASHALSVPKAQLRTAVQTQPPTV